MMKEVSVIDHDKKGWHFDCWWGRGLKFLDEFWRARETCEAYDVSVAPGDAHAHIGGNATSSEENRTQVACVHSYFREHGWNERRSPKTRA